MNDQQADKYVNHMGEGFDGMTKEEVRRWLRILVKEVERDTRHKCAEMANRLASDIHNLNHTTN